MGVLAYDQSCVSMPLLKNIVLSPICKPTDLDPVLVAYLAFASVCVAVDHMILLLLLLLFKQTSILALKSLHRKEC